jgi:hypothetical protein
VCVLASAAQRDKDEAEWHGYRSDNQDPGDWVEGRCHVDPFVLGRQRFVRKRVAVGIGVVAVVSGLEEGDSEDLAHCHRT